MTTVAAWLSLLLSGLGLFLSSWIVIPAPTFDLLPLAVGAPEISPLLLLGNLLTLGFAVLIRKRGLRYLAIACSLIGLVLSSQPLLQLPTTLQEADTQMQAALGRNYAQQIPADIQAKLRQHPVVLTDLLTGLPIPIVRHDHQTIAASDKTPLDLEIYRPRADGTHPTIVTIYGGAWQWGEPSLNATFNRYMAAQGYTVVAIDYRHAPRYRFPAQLQDVQTALKWVIQQAGSYSVDPTRIALMGWSSGAHLALLAAYQPDALPVRAVVSYYGPTNLTAGYQNPPNPDPINSRAVLEALLGGSPTQLPTQYEQASPIHYATPGLPPSLLIYGSRDHLVRSIFGQQLYEQLRRTGNTAVLIPLPWSEHSFDAVFRGLGNQIALYHTERFLAWALRS